MKIDFQQGIITYPTTKGLQVFLVKTGNYVSLQTIQGKVDITFAHGLENYLFTESSNINNAWGPLLPNTDYWLYWDIDPLTAIRTFGFTNIEPTYGKDIPTGIIGLHWFDIINHKMFVYQSDGWRNVIRVFAAKVNNTIFYGLGTGSSKNRFIGSQVELTNVGLNAFPIITDNTTLPIHRSNGLLFTTNNNWFTNNSYINKCSFDNSIITGTALETISQFKVVVFSKFGKIKLANYNDIDKSVIAISMQNLTSNQQGIVCIQGVITNSAWNFLQIGVPLWVNTAGLLTAVDPFITNATLYPYQKGPIARVISSTSIFFEPGIGGKGIVGRAMSISTATSDNFGFSKLSVPANNLTNPIIAGDNDPRLLPYEHPITHPATMITTNTEGNFNGLTFQTQLHQLADRDLNSLGNVIINSPTTTDCLTWNGTNWINYPIISNDYLRDMLDVSFSTLSTNQVLKYNGTKWVNVSPAITLTGDLSGTGYPNTPTTLATVNSNIGTFGTDLDIPVITLNNKGLVTAVSTVAIPLPTAPNVLWGWGDNSYGDLGNGTTISKSVPIQINFNTDWKQISSGHFCTIAIKTDGTLWSWGDNQFGQLGDGTIVPKSSPIQIGSLTNWTQVSCAGWHTTAIKTNGTLWVWGRNDNGQLGDGTIVPKSSPIQIGSLTNWKYVTCHSHATVAIKTDGTLWTWGYNANGILGDGTRTHKSSPIQIGSLTNWKYVNTGLSNEQCAVIKTDGTLWTWGYNGWGNLGDGTQTAKSSPTQVGSLTNWSHISCGYNYTMAVKTDGTLWGWGTANFIGNGNSDWSSSPIQIGSLTNWKQVNCVYLHTIALKTDGTLWAWGYNGNGQLGLGDKNWRTSPTQVGSLTSWGQIACGYDHTIAIAPSIPLEGITSFDVIGGSTGLTTTGGPITGIGSITLNGTLSIDHGGTSANIANDAFNNLAPDQSSFSINETGGSISCGYSYFTAIKTDGTLWSCGYNGYGQLGNGLIYVNYSSPIQIGSLNNWKQLSSAGYTCAIKKDGTLWAWGDNYAGQLGDGTRVPKSSPIQIGSLTNWKYITCGGGNLSIKTDGTLWAWGQNNWGNLGDGTTIPKSSPIQIGSLTDWKQLSNSARSTAAIKTDGTLWTCGYNDQGQLGDGTQTNKSSPIQIGSLTNWMQVNVNGKNTAAVKTDGTLWTWGWNGYGQLGDGTRTSRFSPIQIGSLTDWVSVIVSDISMHAIKTDGTLWAWGDNYYGMLGDGTQTAKSSPIQIGSLTNWKQLNPAQGNFISATKTDGTLWTWGRNNNGQLGDGTTVNKSSPIQIGNLTNWEQTGTSIFISTCLQTDGYNTHWTPILQPPVPGLYVWGDNWWGQLGIGYTSSYETMPLYLGNKSDWAQIVAGYRYFGVITTNGSLWTCGSNTYGQLGDGTRTNQYSPIQIGSLTDWKYISCGYDITHAIKTDGTLWAWGLNDRGQLGDGTRLPKSSPVQIGSLTNWKQIEHADGFCMAIKTDGTLWGWGANNFGYLGDSTYISVYGSGISSPIQIGSLTNWKQLACGYGNTSAIKTDGTLWSWGSNSTGGLGLGNTYNASSPIQVGSLTNWKTIAAGYNNVAAIKTDGTLWTWGYNRYGGLGLGDTTKRSSPCQVGSLTDWTIISVGYNSMAAIKTNGTAWVWGFSTNTNYGGMLGDGYSVNRSSPVQVAGSLTSWTNISVGEYSTYGTVLSNQQNVLSIYQGGTGQITAQAAINALLPSQTGQTNKALSFDGNNFTWLSSSNLP